MKPILYIFFRNTPIISGTSLYITENKFHDIVLRHLRYKRSMVDAQEYLENDAQEREKIEIVK